ncbi:MAG: ribokinase, partial [Armatimonadota bacterium]|nr:ribokinase [Armatimonadota bacterium]
MGPRIVVVGSLNMDLVIKTPRIPAVGETVLGEEFHTYPGGKGANQAVASARLGAEVFMVGRVGKDTFGRELLQSVASKGVDTRFVLEDPVHATGVAFIAVDGSGNNAIVVAPGANMHVSPADVDQAEEVMKDARALILQLEIPIETVLYTAQIAKNHGVPVILDPAPAAPLPARMYELVDVLVPNEHEAEVLTGIPIHGPEEARDAARILQERGVPVVIVKLGPSGALLMGPSGVHHVPGVPVQAVDTTAAGDAFAGGFAVALAEGKDLLEATRFANYV